MDEERVARALIGHLLSSEPGWGMLELVGQRPQSTLYRAAHGVADARFRVRDIAVEPYNEIALVWADVHGYFRSLPKKMRSNVSRMARRLFAAGEPELVLASGARRPRPGSGLTAIWMAAAGNTAPNRPSTAVRVACISTANWSPATQAWNLPSSACCSMAYWWPG